MTYDEKLLQICSELRQMGAAREALETYAMDAHAAIDRLRDAASRAGILNQELSEHV